MRYLSAVLIYIQSICEQYGIRHLWPRLLSAYGLYDRPQTLVSLCIDACRKKNVIELTPCEQIWDFINVKDVANALYLIAKNGKHGVKYPIGSGVGLQLKTFVEIISQITGFSGLLEGIGRKPYVDNQVMYLCSDLAELKCEIGFIPEVSFSDGIEEIWNQLS